MATKQGMCRNCGSLVVFDDRDDTCECVFCHCVFPSQEAVNLLNNHEGHEFKNEKFEAQEGGKHYYSNPVMPDTVQKAVARDKVSKKGDDDLKLKPSEFEISPNDVKAPPKILMGIIAGTVAIVGLILAISIPMYLKRSNLKKAITAELDTAMTGIAENEKAGSDSYRQYNVYGLTCQSITVGLSYDISDTEAGSYYAKYCDLRASKRGGDKSGKVTMQIYTPDTIYVVDETGVKADKQEAMQIVETTAESEPAKK